jgi:hypothetical protein
MQIFILFLFFVILLMWVHKYGNHKNSMRFTWVRNCWFNENKNKGRIFHYDWFSERNFLAPLACSIILFSYSFFSHINKSWRSLNETFCHCTMHFISHKFVINYLLLWGKSICVCVCMYGNVYMRTFCNLHKK